MEKTQVMKVNALNSSLQNFFIPFNLEIPNSLSFISMLRRTARIFPLGIVDHKPHYHQQFVLFHLRLGRRQKRYMKKWVCLTSTISITRDLFVKWILNFPKIFLIHEYFGEPLRSDVYDLKYIYMNVYLNERKYLICTFYTKPKKMEKPKKYIK